MRDYVYGRVRTPTLVCHHPLYVIIITVVVMLLIHLFTLLFRAFTVGDNPFFFAGERIRLGWDNRAILFCARM